MKRSTLIGLGVIAGLVILGGRCSTPREPVASAAAPQAAAVAEAKAEDETGPSEMDKAREEVTKHFLSDAEPKAKDAVWTSDRIFKVGMISDGTDRSGYAEYVCNVLYDHGFRGKKVWVQVIDIVKLTRTDRWEKLGEAHCI